MPIDDSSGTNKRARYTPDLIPSSNYVASVNSVSTLNTPNDLPEVILLTSDVPKIRHTIMRDKNICDTERGGY